MWVGPMTRDHFTEAKRRLHESFALLDSWIEDLKTQEESVSIHDRAMLIREAVRDALHQIGHLEDAIRARQQEP